MKTFLTEDVKDILTNKTIFWFRRDLRIDDNAGLYYALKREKNVVPLFIFDTEILDELEDKNDARVSFIHQSISHLKDELEKQGSSLVVLHGNPIEIFNELEPYAVYTNHDYEPYAINRDAKVKELLDQRGSTFSSFKDQVIFEKREILKDNDDPYTVFTPYSQKWKSSLNDFHLKSYPTKEYTDSFLKISPQHLPPLTEIGFKKSEIKFPSANIPQLIIKNYHHHRDFPSQHGTSKLGVHLRFGTLSIRKVVKIAKKINDTWLNELIWREFYQMILWHFPHVIDHCFRPEYERIEWRNNAEEFDAWVNGLTGYPLVDAGMRELNATGYMHNRVRMVTASFLTKHLLIDWRWGESYFARKLLDYELASNNGSWQWAAGTGCDAAPYFRVFNPELQSQKFDANQTYIRTWIPEIGTKNYPEKIVDHKFARERAISAYQKALKRQ